jgi:hypothetical protein
VSVGGWVCVVSCVYRCGVWEGEDVVESVCRMWEEVQTVSTVAEVSFSECISMVDPCAVSHTCGPGIGDLEVQRVQRSDQSHMSSGDPSILEMATPKTSRETMADWKG